MNVKMTFTIPEDVANKLKETVKESKRSAFVTNAVRDKLQELEWEQLEQDLIEGYKERYEEDKAINAEWEAATLESWP